MEEVRSDSFEVLIPTVLLLSLCKVSEGVHLWTIARILDFPRASADVLKQILFAPEKWLAKIDLAGGKLPLLGKPIAYDKVSPILGSVVKGSPVWASRVNLLIVFRGSTVCAHLACWQVCVLVRGVVVKVDGADIRILSIDALVQLSDFSKLLDVLSLVHKVIVHDLVS